MKNYDPNIYNGTHEVKVTIQQWDYVGHIFYSMGGNCSGKTILDFDFECSDGTEKNDCNLTYNEDEEYFTAILKNENGDELEVSGEAEEFNDMMVAVEIMEYYEEN